MLELPDLLRHRDQRLLGHLVSLGVGETGVAR
jgi:hypothetical protein